MMETDLTPNKFNAVEKLFADIIKDIRNNLIDDDLLKSTKEPDKRNFE